MPKLFSERSWDEIKQRVLGGLKNEVNMMDGNRLLNTSVDDLCKYFVEKYWVDIPILNRNEITKDYEDIRLEVRGDHPYSTDNQSAPVYVQGVSIEINVPYTGDDKAFWWQPTTYTLDPPYAAGSYSGEYLILEITGTNLGTDTVIQKINDTLDKIDDYLTSLREDAGKLNGDLDSIARQYIEVRRTELLKNRKLFASLPFELKQRNDSAKTYTVPEVRRKIIPTLPEASSQSYQPDPFLNQENYEHILEVIENMARVMEYSPAAFSDMEEEMLRWHFLVQLNGHYEGQATGETFNYEGKTDILIRSEGKNIFIAECKYWGGSKTLTAAIDQLLGYSSWRDTKVAVIVFNRNKDFTNVLKSIKSTTKEHPNYKRELDPRSETSFRFIFSHRDDPNREMTLTVMAFDVPK